MKQDDTKDIMTQEKLDACIASARAEEGKENQPIGTLRQRTCTPRSEVNLPTSDGAQKISQSEIDLLIAQQQDTKGQTPLNESEVPGKLSQSSIDSLIAKVPDQETPAAFSKLKDSAAVSQRDIDVMIAQKQSDAAVDNGKNAWAQLNRDLLSQEEIDALLSGFVIDEPEPNQDLGADATKQESGYPPDPIDEVIDVSPNNFADILREKEKKFLQKKRRAASLLRALIEYEKERISDLQARKEKMCNDEMYRRYEINRADRTKIVVSMSERNAEQYRSSHLGCCIHRI